MAQKILWILLPILALAGNAQGDDDGITIKISSKKSIAYMGSLDSFEITEAGTQAAKFLLDYLEQRDDRELLRLAISIYNRIIPIENYGGEYSALQWFCEYFLANDAGREKLLADRYVKSFFEYMATNDFAALKHYIKSKYHLGEVENEGSKEAIERERFLEDFILFNNPKREKWEASSKILSVLDLKKDASIVDVGSGPGYFSFQFSDIVGEKGQVYAVDTVQKHLDYMQSVMDKYSIHNIELVHVRANAIGVPENVADIVFLCSLYHVVYLTSMEEVKDQFIASIKKALKPDGTLFIVDNALVEDKKLPYHGPYIAKELIIAQLHYYGFDLTAQYAFIPQRYILVFKQR